MDDLSAIFSMIKDLCNYKEDGIIELDVLKKRVMARGFTVDALESTINHYERLDVLMRNSSNTIRIIK
jgi:hypothetical protein